MRITLLAVGKMKASPERDLVKRYETRLTWPLKVIEVAQSDKTSEAKALLSKLPSQAMCLVLDERGQTLSSDKLAEQIGRWQSEGHSDLACVIGGADGLSHEVRDRADFTLAFGPATWPHMLVRPMLLEQLYRAQSILAGHPYHRA